VLLAAPAAVLITMSQSLMDGSARLDSCEPTPGLAVQDGPYVLVACTEPFRDFDRLHAINGQGYGFTNLINGQL
jgi:hypothetical protein